MDASDNVSHELYYCNRRFANYYLRGRAARTGNIGRVRGESFIYLIAQVVPKEYLIRYTLYDRGLMLYVAGYLGQEATRLTKEDAVYYVCGLVEGKHYEKALNVILEREEGSLYYFLYPILLNRKDLVDLVLSADYVGLNVVCKLIELNDVNVLFKLLDKGLSTYVLIAAKEQGAKDFKLIARNYVSSNL
jgi:hypothetical protein